MLLTENYILSNEVSKKGNIHIANFSNFAKHVESYDILDTVLKQGNCTFLNKHSLHLPKNFKEIISTNTFTNLQNTVLSTYFCTYFECLRGDILKANKTEKGTDVNITEFKVQGKSFLKFNDELSKQLKKVVLTNIPKKDFFECLENNYIEDGIRLSRNNYMVWYKY